MAALGHSRASGNPKNKRMDCRFRGNDKLIPAEVYPCESRGGHDSLFYEAQKYLVGGVNSPVRSFKAVGGEPIFIKSAKGCKIYSEDGRAFIDYCMAFGPLILGHSHPAVVEALEMAIKNGVIFGAATKLETGLAKLICEALPSIARVRFTNSGTEAVMTALRLARAYTKRDKIIKFKEGYHGHVDYLLESRGVPYNDLEEVIELAKKDRDIAAIIVEPVAGNRGVILPKEGFLKGLRDIADRFGIVLIFDEVITGFRLCYGGAQGLFNVKPDLTCLGKIIGGGLPIGAVGGRADIMRLLAPEGPVYQAGTFSGNPLTMSAGLAALRQLREEDPYEKLETLTRRLCEGLLRPDLRSGLAMTGEESPRNDGCQVNFIGSMFSVSCDAGLFGRLHRGLLEEGVYLAPSNLETNFVSTAHSDEDIEKTLESVKKTLSSLRAPKGRSNPKKRLLRPDFVRTRNDE